MNSAASKTRNGRQVRPVVKPISDPTIPLLFEDDGFENMGDSDVHTRTTATIFYGAGHHLSPRRQYRVFANLNLRYSTNRRKPYISPDIMVVEPFETLPENIQSYSVGVDGPAPLFVTEVLSERTFQQRDLTDKPLIYAKLQVPEYAIVDVTGQFLSVHLLLKVLQPDGAWKDVRDADGGITSRLGFRITMDSDGQARIREARTGKPYARPDEAAQRIRDLEMELARLRRPSRKRKK
jgi:Uma2 family endonuclease